jgi:CBS domain containing-hemolysin-like protein
VADRRNNIFYVRPTVTCDQVKEAIKGHHQDIFPVVKANGVYLGFIRRIDLYECVLDEEETIGELLKRQSKDEHRIVYVYEETSLTKARRIMDCNRMDLVPVVRYDGMYEGTLGYFATMQ